MAQAHQCVCQRGAAQTAKPMTLIGPGQLLVTHWNAFQLYMREYGVKQCILPVLLYRCGHPRAGIWSKRHGNQGSVYAPMQGFCMGGDHAGTHRDPPVDKGRTHERGCVPGRPPLCGSTMHGMQRPCILHREGQGGRNISAAEGCAAARGRPPVSHHLTYPAAPG